MFLNKYISKLSTHNICLIIILCIIICILIYLIYLLYILINNTNENFENNNYKVLIIGNFHNKNEEGCKRILEYLKLENKFINIDNIDNEISNYNVIYSPNQYIDTSKYPHKKFIFGPHFSVFPDNNQLSLIKNIHNNSIYIQPSIWAADVWINKKANDY